MELARSAHGLVGSEVKNFEIARPGESLSVLCLGAHADDIEIGVGGTILEWIGAGAKLHVRWCVLSAAGRRADEARASAASFLAGATAAEVEVATFPDGLFPYHGYEIKSWMEDLKDRVQPDLVFSHRFDDAHQDHREVSRLTWNTFRDHLIFEYEIPKWDGDISRPNVYSVLAGPTVERKISLLLSEFPTQRSKDWFDAETFRALARLRGLECRAPDRYAEGLFLRKGRVTWTM